MPKPMTTAEHYANMYANGDAVAVQVIYKLMRDRSEHVTLVEVYAYDQRDGRTSLGGWVGVQS